GTITLNGIAGLTFTVGDGTADGTMTFSGTGTDINAALNDVSFQSAADFNGAASIQIVTTDSGSLSDSDTVAITVNAVNDAPVNAVPGAQTVNEDTAKVFSSGNGNQISISDVNNTLYLHDALPIYGTITLNGIAGLTFTVGDGTADGTMTFS